MLDPFITPCCDQKLLRYFFERVDSVGHSTFFCKEDYPMSQFLDWIVSKNTMSEITLAVPVLDVSVSSQLRHLLSQKIYSYAHKKNMPLIQHLNLIVGKDVNVPEELVNNQLVTVAKDSITYNYLLIHRLYGRDDSNRNIEADTAEQKKNLEALKQMTESLLAQHEEGNITHLAQEKLEGAWIDYMLSSNLATSSKGTYYTLHGKIQQDRSVTNCTSSVTCVKGKYAYDEVMQTLSSVLRRKKVK